MVKRLYARVGALCKTRPEAMWGGMMVFTTTAFLVNPLVWNQPGFAWIAAAVLLPMSIIGVAMISQNRAKRRNV